MEWEVSGDELSRRNFTLAEFARIYVRNYFYLSCFLFANAILHVKMLRGIDLGNFFTA